MSATATGHSTISTAVVLTDVARGNTAAADVDLTYDGEFILSIVQVSNPSGRAMITSAVKN